MKNICTLLILTLLLFSCKKVGEPLTVQVDFHKISTTFGSATTKGSYEHNMVPNDIVIIYAESADMLSSVSKEMNVDGNNFDVTLTELKANVKYYFKLRFDSDINYYETKQYTFVTDDGGEDSEGPDNPEEIHLPSLEIMSIDNITQTEAVFRAKVISDGGASVTSKGFCWSMTQNPTTDDFSVSNISELDEFYNGISNLTPNTTYYVRAFAENSEGVGYSSQVSIKTLEEDAAVNTTTISINGVSFVMVEVEGGTFMMGGSGVGSNLDESPVHEVTLSTYYIGETEVTQKLWKAVMEDNPSYNVGDNKAVDNIIWDMAQGFVEKLSSLSGRKFRLPTETEWEYAARGGSRSEGYKYSGSNSVANVAWYKDNSNYKSQDVMTKMPNELGIYDMSGNLFEWCSDWYGGYNNSSQTDPAGSESGNNKVVRGGSFSYDDSYCRVTDRFSGTPSWYTCVTDYVSLWKNKM